jgi:hypothetical protein
MQEAYILQIYGFGNNCEYNAIESTSNSAGGKKSIKNEISNT